MRHSIVFLFFAILVIGCKSSPIPENSEPNLKQEEAKDEVIAEDQIVDDCDTFILITLWENLEEIDLDAIGDFLEMAKNDCKTHIEFSEMWNELLFILMNQYPASFLDQFQKSFEICDTAILFSNMRNPLSDIIPLDSLLKKIKSLEDESRYKVMILEQLEIAKSKY